MILLERIDPRTLCNHLNDLLTIVVSRFLGAVISGNNRYMPQWEQLYDNGGRSKRTENLRQESVLGSTQTQGSRLDMVGCFTPIKKLKPL